MEEVFETEKKITEEGLKGRSLEVYPPDTVVFSLNFLRLFSINYGAIETGRTSQVLDREQVREIHLPFPSFAGNL
ncbi:hypothetical protein MHLP_02905 [Candidatus Mycoplasma haematolamae str. Purdue]|uniref:Uncharacterized protein n=1 Tax=Mycoplasma haematolamae (strain Purdue) TaxID=1212765 RepID=I7CG05_MYCHA|nr:hypothetical protein [Candidatus Mycoplasma haematolamae]AFO52161.1 hypothetical protein MHLP_02905 [Candidatus Mycoplasma haematolamae str. Purdue]